MASTRMGSCMSVNPAVNPIKYRSTRLGVVTPETRRLHVSSLITSFKDASFASSSGRGNGLVGGGDGRRGDGQVAMCSASMEGIRHGAVASAAAVPAVSVVPERVKVVVMMAAVMLLCNADRVVMSVAVVPLASQYGWSSSFLGIVQSSFLWGYVFSSMVGGALADRYGGKKVMACAATLWSLATFLTPWAASHSTIMLLAVRALFGLAEGVAFPNHVSAIVDTIFKAHHYGGTTIRHSAPAMGEISLISTEFR